MLIAEDLLLLIMDDADGKPAVDGTAADHALAGAVLAELVAGGHLDHVEPARWSKEPRLVRREGSVLSDELLAERLGRLATPRTGSATVQRLATGLRTMVRDRLVVSGHLRQETHRVLGVFPVSRYPEQEPGHEDRVRGGLGQVLRGERPAAPREVVLLSLLDAVKGLRKVLPAETAGLDDERLATRVAEVSADEAVPAAVRKAVADARAAVDAAVMVAVMGAAVGTAGSS
ncbi:GOLPH3/VPS74 family protein [Aquipuribacter sp. MA13-6]|uniref:GOLPH3/VPS74 family protein n=1 Tax=unclassified Aquipuribacter TaxID=2635084 RepID=UPI003EECF486